MVPVQKIRVLIAEDEALLRHTLAALLDAEEDIDVVGHAPNGEAAVLAARDRQADVVLMDIDMPKLDGIEATRQITEDLPDCKVVMLTIAADDDSIFRAIKAGAQAYVVKSASPEEVCAAIRAVAEGGGHLSPEHAAKVMAEFARISRLRASAETVFAELSRREMEILRHLGEGRRNRDIATELFISEKTVKNHVSSILSKLHVNDRTEAALLAARHGLTDPT